MMVFNFSLQKHSFSNSNILVKMPPVNAATLQNPASDLHKSSDDTLIYITKPRHDYLRNIVAELRANVFLMKNLLLQIHLNLR